MRVPSATYRLQFSSEFTFENALSVVPYLRDLGISDLYASPIFKSRQGSPHGYDVCDPTEVNPELGGYGALERLSKALRDDGIGWMQDVVPNHMAFDSENEMLMDVLENGEHSQFFTYFDIEWDHPYESIRQRVLAPFLGERYATSLEAGDVRLIYDEKGFGIRYYEFRLPLRVESYVTVLTHRMDTLENTLGEDHPDYMRFLGILYILKNLPAGEDAQDRSDQVRVAKGMLGGLYRANLKIKEFIDTVVAEFNGEKGKPESFNLLHDLLSEQLFRLSFWKVATEEINYRRFFTINGLISLKVERERVFDDTHVLILRLVREGLVTGLRIDHIDGLYDPTGYLKRLGDVAGDVFIVVEKILERHENLPAFWPVQGTTGYDFLNISNGVFVAHGNATQFSTLYRRRTSLTQSYDALVADKKRMIIGKHMAGDVDNLAHLMKRVSSRYRYGTDITLYGLRRAIVEVMAHFPVYRTYISPHVASAADRDPIREAVANASAGNPGLVNELRFVERFLLLDFDLHLSEEDRQEWIYVAMRFQQFTGPLMAKGFEDTVMYVYNRLISLNEVGGFPEAFGVTPEEFHAFNRTRSRRWPHSLNATATHDTKRGEDVRARINVLSEIPREWAQVSSAWVRLNRAKKRKINGRAVPDTNDEYFLYQTLIGAFPFEEEEYPTFVERMKEYVVKAVREAKTHTAWLKPDSAYEDAYLFFVQRLLDPSDRRAFLPGFLPFQRKIAFYGILNSLSQTLIKLTAPGIPDFYQGTELWDLSLVDPDNRRPVNYGIRARYLEGIKKGVSSDMNGLIEELWSTMEDGRLKLFLIHRVLAARRARQLLFQQGRYFPLNVDGRFRDHIVAFARTAGRHWAITIAPRWLSSVVGENHVPLGEVWDDTAVAISADAPRRWRNVVTDDVFDHDQCIPVAHALRCMPVALIMDEEGL